MQGICNGPMTIYSNDDIQREIRNMFMRTNLLVRHFIKCSHEVKLVLFRAYCICLYDACFEWTQNPNAMVRMLLLRIRTWTLVNRDTFALVPDGSIIWTATSDVADQFAIWHWITASRHTSATVRPVTTSCTLWQHTHTHTHPDNK